MEKTTILVVDDEPSMIELLQYNLEKEGYEVATARNGDEALEAFGRRPFALVILDVMMPGRDGFEVCREIRAKSSVPIILLTAKDSEANKVVGLELGADDYVTKPFSVAELVARVRAAVRRATVYDAAETAESLPLSLGELTIDRKKREVTVGGRQVELTAKEFELLCLFASHPGIVFTREEALDRVWGNEAYVVERAVDVHVRHLRQKIEKNPEAPVFIKTVRGVGYRFEAQ